jgi:hypothetical protein
MTNMEQNEWARRRAQVEMIEKWARIAGTLLDAGAIEVSLPITERQAYEAELRMLNPRIDQVVRGIRETFAGIL